jgi:hypothetical protein
VLRGATGNTDTQDSPRPGLGGNHHLPPYSILWTSLRGPHPNGFSLPGLLRDSRVGVLKSRWLGLPGLWSPITLQADLKSKCSLKQSCSSHRKLSNGTWHVVCNQVNRVDSRLFLVRNQIGSLTPGPSFDHNLCFRCPNEQCDPILDIYVSRAFQWYKKRHNSLSFDPSNRFLKFWESTGTPSPKVGVALGVWGFTPSHSPTLSGVYDVTHGLPLGSHPCNPFALIASPKLRLQHHIWI